MKEKLQNKIDSKTKPLGALGQLERIALKVGMVQNTLSPQLIGATIVTFAGDHGIAQEGISAYPTEVSAQMVLNFLNGGAAINVFCEQNQIDLYIVDSGVAYNFEPCPKLIDAKIARGTQNFLYNNAMTKEQLERCFLLGSRVVDKVLCNKVCNVIGFGEMGIGNTAAASILMSYLCDIPLEKCVGRGTGLSDAQLRNKLQLLLKAQQFHGKQTDVQTVLMKFGGFEMVQMTAAMLQAYKHNMLILVDGFITTASFIAAYRINPAIIQNALFCHQSDESGHKLMLQYLNAEPILQLGLRLGEGTGCALAYPIIKNAVAFLNNMHSFESANISQKNTHNETTDSAIFYCVDVLYPNSLSE